MNDRKKMIMDAFWKLLEEMPYNKISVRLIVERCGVNRNTFYYYFQDIPALVEEILNGQIDLLIARHCRVGSLEECISLLAHFFVENKKIASILCTPAGRIYQPLGLPSLSPHRSVYYQYYIRLKPACGTQRASGSFLQVPSGRVVS